MAIRSWVARVYLKGWFLLGGPSEDFEQSPAQKTVWQWWLSSTALSATAPTYSSRITTEGKPTPKGIDSLQSQWVLSAYTDQTGNSSKAAYSQVQTVPSHNAQQAEVNTQTGLSPQPTNANHPDRAKFERNGACNAMNTYNRSLAYLKTSRRHRAI